MEIDTLGLGVVFGLALALVLELPPLERDDSVEI